MILNTSEEKVLKIMTNIESSKAAGVDKLSSRFLKDGANILAKPISALCNLSVSQGVFPSAFKVAKLKPIFKKAKKIDTSNYRPVSLLSSILKIIEKVIHDPIDHEILLQKIKAIKFSESTIKWFKSYLFERIFLVNIEHKLSDFGEISSGVPKGPF